MCSLIGLNFPFMKFFILDSKYLKNELNGKIIGASIFQNDLEGNADGKDFEKSVPFFIKE